MGILIYKRDNVWHIKVREKWKFGELKRFNEVISMLISFMFTFELSTTGLTHYIEFKDSVINGESLEQAKHIVDTLLDIKNEHDNLEEKKR